MIPKSEIDDKIFHERLKEYEGLKFNSFDFKLTSENTISGHVDDEEAIKQVAYFILSTERFQYNTMSDNTGIETWDLYGETSEMLYLEIRKRIKEALLCDDRIVDIEDFIIKHEKKGVFFVSLVIVSNVGERIPIEREVSISGNN